MVTFGIHILCFYKQQIAKANKLPLQREDNTFTIVASRSHMSAETEGYIEKMRDIHGEVKLISKGSSLKLCMVAQGTANCYPRFAPTMEWDSAAAHGICKVLGIEVMDLETKKEGGFSLKLPKYTVLPIVSKLITF